MTKEQLELKDEITYVRRNLQHYQDLHSCAPTQDDKWCYAEMIRILTSRLSNLQQQIDAL